MYVGDEARAARLVEKYKARWVMLGCPTTPHYGYILVAHSTSHRLDPYEPSSALYCEPCHLQWPTSYQSAP
jgi:hypothetical protein